MTTILKLLLLMLAPLLITDNALADDNLVGKSRVMKSNLDTPNKLASLSDLSFLTGTWASREKSGAYTEEYWSSLYGDSMVGHCRIVKAGKTSFYELLALVNTPSGVVLRMRHCNGDFEPWKESDEAGDLVITSFDSGKQVTFENEKVRHVRVIYKNLGAKKLSVLIEDTQDGKVSSYPFEFERVD